MGDVDYFRAFALAYVGSFVMLLYLEVLQLPYASGRGWYLFVIYTVIGMLVLGIMVYLVRRKAIKDHRW